VAIGSHDGRREDLVWVQNKVEEVRVTLRDTGDENVQLISLDGHGFFVKR